MAPLRWGSCLSIIGGGCWWLLLVVAVVVASSAFVTAKDKPHRVKSLPGWTGPLRSRTYSGYATITKEAPVNATMHVHYMLFESEADPVNDPIIVWWNGGPGANSLWGIFVENGPYLLNEQSYEGQQYEKTGIPTLISNPFSWTAFATLVTLSSPAPIGFSYCSPPGPAFAGGSCGEWNDTRTAIAGAEGLRILFGEHFPHLLDNPNRDVFFIGESYAGVYISTTTREVVTNARYQKIAGHLAGVALGDACLGTDIICGYKRPGPYYKFFFLYGHGQLPTEMWNELMRQCTIEELKQPTQSAACKAMVNVVKTAAGGWTMTNLYDTCITEPPPPSLTHDNTSPTTTVASLSSQIHRSAQRRSSRRIRAGDGTTSCDGAGSSSSCSVTEAATQFSGYWCPGNVFDVYMNHTRVREALHVPLDSLNWEPANGWMNYTLTETNVLPFLASLLNQSAQTSHSRHRAGTSWFTNKTVRLMSYNGDADAIPILNTFATQDVWYAFARNQSYVKSNEWRSWTTGSNVVGGYVVDWKDSQLSYVTVRGAGHSVPEFKPLAAQVLMRNWVHNRSLPPYNFPSPP